jgi:Spy/CpxP family protein refolding chaperone
VPSILPTLRLIDAQMAPTLGFVLNLTDDQKTKVLDLLTKSDNDQKPKIEAQAKAAQDYIALLGKSDATQTDLLAAADKVLKAESEIMAVRIGALVALRAILTPEQNKKLSDAVAQPAHRWLPQPGAPPAPPLTPPPSAPAPSTGK